jgi:hypothetical protein
MDDTTGRTAANTAGTADREALDALIFDWADAYAIVHEAGCWQARRRDYPGHLLTARDPDELRAAIRADYQLKPVPRDLNAMDGKS